jgi:RimJ/RimL family protein N-acetyltransferase
MAADRRGAGTEVQLALSGGGDRPGARARSGETPVALRPLAGGDDLLLRRWIASPGVRRWFGSAAVAEAEIRFARESEAALCRMIVVGGETVGYAQAIDAGLLGAFPVGLPVGSWLCAVFIGSDDHRGRSYGETALDLLVAETFQSSLAVACAVLIPVRSEVAARACEAIGFRWSAIHDDALLGPCWVMVRERQNA